jgi:hypothetical protein
MERIMSHALRDYLTSYRPVLADSSVSAELAGMRVQLLKVLNRVHGGAQLVYRLETGQIKCGAQCLLGECFIGKDDWLNNQIVPLFVPGTLCPQIVGDALLRFGWVRPADEEADGYTRHYVLTATGERALASAKDWWGSLNWVQKAWLHVME